MRRRVAFKNPGAPLNVAPLSCQLFATGTPEAPGPGKLHRNSPLTPRPQQAKTGSKTQLPGWAAQKPLVGSDWTGVKSQGQQGKKGSVTDMVVLMRILRRASQAP